MNLLTDLLSNIAELKQILIEYSTSIITELENNGRKSKEWILKLENEDITIMQSFQKGKLYIELNFTEDIPDSYQKQLEKKYKDVNGVTSWYDNEISGYSYLVRDKIRTLLINKFGDHFELM